MVWLALQWGRFYLSQVTSNHVLVVEGNFRQNISASSKKMSDTLLTETLGIV